MLSSAAARLLTSLTVTKTATRAFSSSVAASRPSLLSQLMGSSVGQRGAAATSNAAAAAPTNAAEAVLQALPSSGSKVDVKSQLVEQTARKVAADISASFPNTFETQIAKKL